MKPYQRKLAAKWKERMERLAKKLKRKGFDSREPLPTGGT
jgi:hypothetical protein